MCFARAYCVVSKNKKEKLEAGRRYVQVQTNTHTHTRTHSEVLFTVRICLTTPCFCGKDKLTCVCQMWCSCSHLGHYSRDSVTVKWQRCLESNENENRPWRVLRCTIHFHSRIGHISRDEILTHRTSYVWKLININRHNYTITNEFAIFLRRI